LKFQWETLKFAIPTAVHTLRTARSFIFSKS